jgi:predicted glycoside hydrolase/deacetylase ChbG (UPF0249 family)
LEITLRVTVDDVGLAPEIADAALTLHRSGLPICASVAAPGASAVADALRLDGAGIPVGVHVVLTQERALGGPGPLTDPSGRLPARVTRLVAAWAARRFRPEDALREISLQIERLLNAGIRLKHLDGHEHVHALPFLSRSIPSIASRYDISRIRDVGAPGFVSLHRRLAGTLLSWAGRRLRNADRSHRLVQESRLWGFDVSGRMDRRSLDRILERLSDGRNEIVTHPATADLPRYADWGYAWRREFDSLRAPELSAMIEERGIRAALD